MMRHGRGLLSAARKEFLELASAAPKGDYAQGLLELTESRPRLALWFREQKVTCKVLDDVKNGLHQKPKKVPGNIQTLWDEWKDSHLATAFEHDAHYWAVGQNVPKGDLDSEIEFRMLLEKSGEDPAIVTAHYAAFYGPFLDVVTPLRQRLRTRWGLFGMMPEDRGFSSLCFHADKPRSGNVGEAFREDVGKLDLPNETWTTMLRTAKAARDLHERVLLGVLQGEMPHEVAPPSMTIEELEKYTGEDGAPIYIALRGVVYDVSQSQELYGPGKRYQVLTGRDTTCALAKMDLSDQALRTSHYQPKGEQELASVTGWEKRLQAKYPVIASLV
eukprot:Hpha_TRINITY_DN20241_c0_g1::TRINITY_DN20241_c0_g1_i1::g.168267::m.168267